MSDHPVRDTQGALERLGGDEELYHDVFAIFAEDTPLQLAALSAAIQSQQRSEVERLSHSLKSAAANVGGERMRHVALRMESLAREDTLVDIPALFQNLSDEFQAILKHYQESR